MIKIGIIGCGTFAKKHLKILQKLDTFELVGFYENDEIKAEIFERETKLKFFRNLDELLVACNAIDFVCHENNFEIISKIYCKSKHICINFPHFIKFKELQNLYLLSKEAGVKTQFAFLKSFNPSCQKLIQSIGEPIYMEAFFNKKSIEGTNSAILDMLFQQIDILKKIAGFPVLKASFEKISIFSEKPDIITSNFLFGNGCSSHAYINKIIDLNRYDINVYQVGEALSIDFYGEESENSVETEEMLKDFAMSISQDKATFCNFDSSFNVFELVNKNIASIF
jgi:predicted dehydrogenase